MGASKSKSSEKINTGRSKVSSKALLASKMEAGASEMEELLTGNYKPSFSFVRLFQSIDKNNNGSLEQSELDQFVDKALNFLANHSLGKVEGTPWHNLANVSLASLSGPVDGLDRQCVREYLSLPADIGLRTRDRISANLMLLVDTNKNGTIQLEEFEKFEWSQMVDRLGDLVNKGKGVSDLPPSRPVTAIPDDTPTKSPITLTPERDEIKLVDELPEPTTITISATPVSPRPTATRRPQAQGELYLPNLVELAKREIPKRDYVKVGLPGLLDTTLIQIVEYLIGFGPHIYDYSKLTRKDCENFLSTYGDYLTELK